MPSAWRLSLDEVHIRNSSYQFDFVPAIIRNKITLKYYFKTFKDHIPASEIAQFKTEYKVIVAILDLNLTKTGFETEVSFDPDKDLDFPVNMRMIILAFSVVVGLGFLLRYLNRRNVPLFYEDENTPLRGWLIFLAITLALGTIGGLITFARSDFFSNTTWASLETVGSSQFQNIFRLELVFNLIWICGSVATLYWLLMRRDIFPTMFMWYLGILLGTQLILLVCYRFYPLLSKTATVNTGVLSLGRNLIFAAIWITYILRSVQVKATFTKRS